jgi:hypothetical protein
VQAVNRRHDLTRWERLVACTIGRSTFSSEVSSMAQKPNKSGVGLKAPRSSGVTAQHMQSAYIYGSTHQQRRIERWGRMQRKIIQSIGKPAKKDGTQSTDRCVTARKEKSS